MKVVKITAIWCSACLIMNKVWDEETKNKDIDTVSLDIDMDSDEVEKYNVGTLLPVFIFMDNDKEIYRFTGEKSSKEVLEILEEVGIK